MDTADVAELTEEQIQELLAARRRAARLKSLQRLASAGRSSGGISAPSPAGAFTLPLPLGLESANRQIGKPVGEQGRQGDAERGSGGAEEPRSQVTRAYTYAPQQPGTYAQKAPPPLRASAPLPGMAAPRLSLLDRGPGSVRGVSGTVRRLPWGAWRDRALLIVEVAALLALIFVVAGSFSSLGTLNQEIVEARRAQPVATVPAEDMLPGSSFPPSLNGEMPAPVRALVRGGTPVPIPTPGPQAATRIVIPAIEVDSVIVEGDTWEDLKKGVGHHLGTANPGERGNAVYSGHNDVYGEVFRRLEELKPGDTVTVYAGIHLYRYEVKRTRIVSPKEVSVMATTPDATLTLITCYPYRVDTQRVVVIAKLID